MRYALCLVVDSRTLPVPWTTNQRPGFYNDSVQLTLPWTARTFALDGSGRVPEHRDLLPACRTPHTAVAMTRALRQLFTLRCCRPWRAMGSDVGCYSRVVRGWFATHYHLALLLPPHWTSSTLPAVFRGVTTYYGFVLPFAQFFLPRHTHTYLLRGYSRFGCSSSLPTSV